MSNIIDEEDRPFILQKIWCHGQSALPPIIAICSSVYAFRDYHGTNNNNDDGGNNDASPFIAFAQFMIMMITAPVLLCIWPFLSWKAVQAAPCSRDVLLSSSTAIDGRRHYRLLRVGGAFVLGIYLTIVASVEKSTGLGLLLAIFSALAAIETVAFLAIVTCMRSLYIL